MKLLACNDISINDEDSIALTEYLDSQADIWQIFLRSLS
jgi:hypothetical protein